MATLKATSPRKTPYAVQHARRVGVRCSNMKPFGAAPLLEMVASCGR